MARLAPEPPDPARVVHHALPRWHDRFGDVMQSTEDAVTAVRDQDGAWQLHFKLYRSDGKALTAVAPFNANGPRVADEHELHKWGVRWIGPRTWVLSDSIHVEGLYHAYVVLCEVPEPPPWERS